MNTALTTKSSAVISILAAATIISSESAEETINPSATATFRKGYRRMKQTEIVRFALNNRWLKEQRVLDMEAIWIALHYGQNAHV